MRVSRLAAQHEAHELKWLLSVEMSRCATGFWVLCIALQRSKQMRCRVNPVVLSLSCCARFVVSKSDTEQYFSAISPSQGPLRVLQRNCNDYDFARLVCSTTFDWDSHCGRLVSETICNANFAKLRVPHFEHPVLGGPGSFGDPAYAKEEELRGVGPSTPTRVVRT